MIEEGKRESMRKNSSQKTERKTGKKEDRPKSTHQNLMGDKREQTGHQICPTRIYTKRKKAWNRKGPLWEGMVVILTKCGNWFTEGGGWGVIQGGDLWEGGYKKVDCQKRIKWMGGGSLMDEGGCAKKKKKFYKSKLWDGNISCTGW